MEGPHSYLEPPSGASRAPMNALGSPVSALGSPYRVIASSLASHPVALSSAPGVNFVTHGSPQVGMCGVFFAAARWVESPKLEEWLVGSLAAQELSIKGIFCINRHRGHSSFKTPYRIREGS